MLSARLLRPRSEVLCAGAEVLRARLRAGLLRPVLRPLLQAQVRPVLGPEGVVQVQEVLQSLRSLRFVLRGGQVLRTGAEVL